MTKYELLHKLRNTEETLLIELLGLNSEDIVDMCLDLIEQKQVYLHEQIEDREYGT